MPAVASAPASLFPRLVAFCSRRCPKPIQYVGGEFNSTLKDWDSAETGETVRWALMYPDAYEVGLPNQGVHAGTNHSSPLRVAAAPPLLPACRH